jgi:hypothetical protein
VIPFAVSITPQLLDRLARWTPWALLCLLSALWYISSRGVDTTPAQLDELARIHQVELDAVLQSHQVERQELEQNVVVLQRQLAGIQRDHESRSQEIDRARVKRATQITRDYTDDVEGLAELVVKHWPRLSLGH